MSQSFAPVSDTERYRGIADPSNRGRAIRPLLAIEGLRNFCVWTPTQSDELYSCRSFHPVNPDRPREPGNVFPCSLLVVDITDRPDLSPVMWQEHRVGVPYMTDDDTGQRWATAMATRDAARTEYARDLFRLDTLYVYRLTDKRNGVL